MQIIDVPIERSTLAHVSWYSVLSLSLAAVFGCVSTAQPASAVDATAETKAAHFVTSVAQFRTLSAADFLLGCDFRLTGVLTLVDTNRSLIVLQDSTGAVALSCPLETPALKVGESVVLEGYDGCPYYLGFPVYPHRPSIRDVQGSFESPMGQGEYYLTRMRGWLRPDETGHYTFAIASDNSSELWLSLDTNPSKVRRIANILRFDWVNPHEWAHFSSQHSEPILLKAGETYYIEAVQEQKNGGDHLSIAWQRAGLSERVIAGRYLTPWNESRRPMDGPTNGILREYWTNFSSGDLGGLAGPRPFEFGLSVKRLQVSSRTTGQLPKPRPLSFSSQWLAENNFHWVEAEGIVTFAGENGDNAFLELADSKAQVQVRVPRGNRVPWRLARNVAIRVEGVCEGAFDEKGTLMPGLIWASTENGVSITDAATTNSTAASADHSFKSAPSQPAAMVGFYGTRGVVTFNDRVFDKDCLFVQHGNAAVSVSLKDRRFENHLKVGQWVDLGGALQPGRSLPTLTPLVITELGWRAMPEPITEPLQFPALGDRDGRWTEIEGVVHSVNSDGTLRVMGSKGPVPVWLGGTTTDELSRYVDAKLRLWGVLSLSAFENPLLLVPSRSFVELAKPSPADPFGIPIRAIAELHREGADPSSLHRVRVTGEVTLRDADSFFLQDATGGIRVQPAGSLRVKIGDAVTVVGFPSEPAGARTLTDALVRHDRFERVEPAKLDVAETLPVRQNGNLVHVEADLLAQRTIGSSQILQLQERQRIFTATLPIHEGALTVITAGSRLGITGVCDNESSVVPASTTTQEKASLGSLNLWLRSPADVKVLSGPPWWTWKRAAALIGTLLAILSGALLWVHLLRRRLERQKAAQLAASQQILIRLEEERRRIAANLHDGLGQVLLVIRNETLLAMQRTSEEVALRERLDEISGATSQALEEVRQITHGLRPYQLDRLGLTQAMRATVNRASTNSPILFASRVEEVDGFFDNDSEIHVYRIVQEAINNVLKHSAATEAAVVIKNRDRTVSLSIRDNGCGFDVAAMRSAQPNDLGYGLSGIEERVRILGGSLAIDSRPGEGTSLVVEIPVRNHAPGNHHIDRG